MGPGLLGLGLVFLTPALVTNQLILIPLFMLWGYPPMSDIICACPKSQTYPTAESLPSLCGNSHKSERHDAGTCSQSGLSRSDHSTWNSRKLPCFVDVIPQRPPSKANCEVGNIDNQCKEYLSLYLILLVSAFS